MGFHLTVDRNGRVSLWDSQPKALKGKDPHEYYVYMRLSEGQADMITRAQIAAGKIYLGEG